jgi:hypothetical protein
VDEEFLYIVVETPGGTWGVDINGIYLEKLRPWQLRTDEADCTGTITALIDGFHNLGLALPRRDPRPVPGVRGGAGVLTQRGFVTCSDVGEIAGTRRC